MTAGKQARLARMGTGGRYVIVPMDHGITLGAVEGLVALADTVAAVASGGADAVLTQRGVADRVHPNRGDAAYIVHLNGSTRIGPDENDKRRTATVEDAIRAGADAVSFHVNVGSQHEPGQIAGLAEVTSEAERYGLPVLAMTYARGHDVESDDPAAFAEDLGQAVRLGEELGADVVKTAYSGTTDSFERVVESTARPVVIAGGSRGTDEEALSKVRGAMDAGAAGVSMGRSIFQHEDPRAITSAVASVVHDDESARAALSEAGLAVEA